MEVPSNGIGRLRLTIDSRRQLEEALDSAVAELMSRQNSNARDGILVTRHDHRTFTVQFSSDVQRGIVLEQDLRLRAAPEGGPRRREDANLAPALSALC
ncbi:MULTISPECIES: hypothetical protein [Micrococcaceae]|jgi:hypothetical protein|uniref:hypothetical protein n=1 Tax=Micrococcaceae TaxID=1268 RepID=UPI00255750F8|nr:MULTISPECIES: hypothetical protein [Micrococcaceae]MDQ0031564.1 hypothetical protein [Arthrobacter bambusae]MDQ0099788.1 hypothetical protein [Arthrobacter bambusae]